jgi:hypothetical protein
LSKNYTDVFSINQELDNADAFVTLVSGGSSKATNTMASAKAILLKNNSNIAAELLITVMEWKDSSDTDVHNSVDLGPGSATNLRSWSFLLPAGEFMYLPNNRILAYASDVGTAFESAAKAGDGLISTEPLSINSANEFADSTADVDTATVATIASDVTVVDLYMENGHSKFFKVGDLIQVETEIMEIESLGDGSVLAKSKAVVKRGLLGSTAATHADDTAINFFFGNEYLKFNVGKCMSDKKGRFKQRGAFFSKARTSDTIVDGLVPGSVAIGPFYTEGGYLDWGLNGITPNTETGLAASTAYTFHIVVDALREGLPVGEMAEQILFEGFAQGQWNPDLMLLLVEPTMYILIALADMADVEPRIDDNDDPDPEEEITQLEKVIELAKEKVVSSQVPVAIKSKVEKLTENIKPKEQSLLSKEEV